MDLQDLRIKIDEIDDQLVHLFRQRMEISREISEFKKDNGLSVRDEKREQEKLAALREQIEPMLHSSVEDLYETIFSLSRRHQRRLQKDNLILIGMPGCGKTTVGQLLAAQTGRGFLDVDQYLKGILGPIPAFFETHGEEAFRKEETKVIQQFCSSSGMVISTGGGSVTREENFDLLRQNGTVIWLQRDLELLATHGRPLSALPGVYVLYEQRKEQYAHFSDLRIDNNGTLQQTVDAILQTVGR